MRKFFRFILTICIIGLIVYEVYYLVENNKSYMIDHPEQVVEESGEKAEKEEPIENKEEIPVENNSRITVGEIDEIAKLNVATANVHSVEEDVGVEVIGEANKDFFTAMNTNTTRVTIQTAGTMIHIMPFSDMINEEEFHYDERGNLVLYVLTYTGKGDKAKYYLDNGSILDFVLLEDGEEPAEGNTEEQESGENNSITHSIDIKDVSQRGAYLYRRYILKQGK